MICIFLLPKMCIETDLIVLNFLFFCPYLPLSRPFLSESFKFALCRKCLRVSFPLPPYHWTSLSPLVGYQATVECAERGELVASLRRYYQGILERAPIQVKGLHDEVMAQRALDRRLTEELVRFKRAIGGLTAELTDVKRHDQQSFSDAQFSREEVSVLLNN